MMAKTPLILLPGLLCDEALWAHQIQDLADIADMTVADLTRDSTIQDMATRVLAETPNKFALAGLSMGGHVAQEIMRQAPDRVERLALLDTSDNADTLEKTKQRKSFIAQLGVGDFKGVTEKLLPYLIHKDLLGDENLIGIIKASANNIGPDAFVRQQIALMNRPDGTGDLQYIACPTLVLCGRQDVMTPLSKHEEMAAAIPNARLVVIENCGHLSPLEKPEQVNAEMRAWLEN